MVLVVKNTPTNAGDIRVAGSIPGSGRSPGEGNGYPLHLPEKSHGQRSLVQSTGSPRIVHDLVTKQQYKT